MIKMMFLIFLLLVSSEVEAATLTNVINFPAQTIVTDIQSGNNVDYTYEHLFEELGGQNFQITSLALSLIHYGNANQEPTQEAWVALTEQGDVIGKLSKSDVVKTEDTWLIDQNLWKDMTAQNPKWVVKLSEQTSYNNEKLELVQSKLQIEYRDIEAAPAMPEPSVFFLLLSGFILRWRGLMRLGRV